MATDSFSSSFSTSAIGSSSGIQGFPDPFLDYSGMYLPRNLRTMLRWCELMWANNGTYRMALERVCAYFLTKVEILEVADATKKKYEEFLNDTLKVTSQLRTIGLDFLFYGNSFTSMFVPFRRYLRCKSCNFEQPIERTTYTFDQYKFFSTCKKCSYHGEFDVADRRSMEQDKLRIIRWNPLNIRILHHPLSHDMQYLLQIPEDFKTHIRKGTPFYLQHTPWEFIEAIRNNQLFRFNDNIVFHMKEDTLAGLRNRGWGIPRAMSSFKQGYYIQVLKRYNEAIAMDYIVPWRVISPAGPRGQNKLDPLLHANLGEFSTKVRAMIAEHRRDPLALHSLPFPISYQMIGGEGSQLAPSELLSVAHDEMLNSIGVPAELYKGTLQVQSAPTALRLFEATWPHLVSGFNNWLNWLLEGVAMSFNWERARARMTPVTRADDMEARVIRLQLSAAQKISDQTALGPLGIDVRDEIRRIADEQRMMREEMTKVQKEEEQAMEMQRRLSETAAMMSGAPPMGGPAGGGMPPMAGGGAMQPPGGMLPGAGGGGPTTPGDLLTKADQIAQQLLAMPEGERRRQLSEIRKSDETLHAIVKERLSRARSQARSVGQDQVLSQMAAAPQYGGM